MGLQRFQFAVHRNTHRARCPFDNRFRRMAVSPMQACKLFETAVEDLFRTGQVIATPRLSGTDESSIPDQNLSSNASASRAAELRIRVL